MKMATEYLIDGIPHLDPILSDPDMTPSSGSSATAQVTTIIVEPKEDVTRDWATRSTSPSDTACIAMLIGRNTPTKTKSILIPPSKRLSLSPSALSPSSSSRTSSITTSSFTPGDETTSEITSSLDSLKRFSTIDPGRRASLQPSEQDDEKTLKEQRLNVTFAPLPDLGPRKRRGMPLGVAARSRLVRRRRASVTEGGPQQFPVSTPMWTDEEMEDQRQRLARAWENERDGRDYYSDVDENGEPYEDPLAAFGKIVKDAGKQLWHRMASREGKDKSAKGEDKGSKGKDKESAKAEDETSLEKTQAPDSGELSQPSDAPTLPLLEMEQRGPSIENQRPADSDKDDEGTFSWEEVGGKELPPIPHGDNATRKRYPWSRIRTISKPKDPTPVLAKSHSGRSFVHSLRTRSSERSKVEANDKEKYELSISSGLRRSLSF